MKYKATFSGLIAFAFAVFAASSLLAQEKKDGKTTTPSREEMMARWQEFMTPGATHKKLDYFVGSWNVKSESWMNGPDGPATTSQGTAEYKMILGGRYLQEDFTGEMMQQPFNGMGFTGYDNFKKKYIGFWIDNSGTAMSTMEGEMDASGKTLTMWGKMDDPATGTKDHDIKYVTRIVDNNTNIFEVYDITAQGDKQPMLKLTYTRKM